MQAQRDLLEILIINESVSKIYVGTYGTHQRTTSLSFAKMMRGSCLIAYIAIARGSPCSVPCWDSRILALTGYLYILEYHILLVNTSRLFVFNTDY